MNQYILGLKEFASALIALEAGDEIAWNLPWDGRVRSNMTPAVRFLGERNEPLEIKLFQT
jgi:hypothetical protein